MTGRDRRPRWQIHIGHDAAGQSGTGQLEGILEPGPELVETALFLVLPALALVIACRYLLARRRRGSERCRLERLESRLVADDRRLLAGLRQDDAGRAE